MFERFSSGYYLGRLYVQAHDGPRAVLRESHHRRVREQLYGPPASSAQTNQSATTTERVTDATGTETTTDETPLVMRYQRQHFVVAGEEDVPEQTLAVPREWLPERPDPLEPREVFLAKADRARQLLQFAVGSTGADGDDESGHSGGDSRGGGAARPPGSPFTPQAFGDVAGPGRRQ